MDETNTTETPPAENPPDQDPNKPPAEDPTQADAENPTEGEVNEILRDILGDPVDEEDSLTKRTVLPGGVISAHGHVLVHSVGTDEGYKEARVDKLLSKVVINNPVGASVSLDRDGVDSPGGNLRANFISDLQGRAYVIRHDDLETDTTTFDVHIGHGVL